MSSGFVSGGTTDQPIERDDEWLKAQQEIEASHRRKEEASRQEGGKTLYEVLQRNKAAKQDAFEESIRLKNQFRNLDEDEVEFLDSVLESTRKKEDEVKKQTSEQLDLFRRQQEEADKAALEGAGEETRGEGIGSKEGGQEETWAVNKGKRKRTEKKKGLKGFKLRKASSSAHDDGEKVDGGRAGSSSHTTGLPSTTPTTKSQPNITAASNSIASVSTSPVENPEVSQAAAKTTQAAPSGLELGGYSSDEDD